MKPILVCLAAASFLLPLVLGQASTDPSGADADRPHSLQAHASNQRIDLTWQAPSNGATGFIVYVYSDGIELRSQNVTETQASFFLTNGQTYVFEVSAVNADGTEGPRSDPVAATPRLENDLAYLAAGLIAVWVGVFGYAALLARKEASIDRKLEQLLQARFQGRSP